MKLTVLNPGLVLGPPADEESSMSLEIVRELLVAKFPKLPDVGYSLVDVRDVAAAHVKAIDEPKTHGKRIILTSDWLWVLDMALKLKDAFPDRNIPAKRVSKFAVWLISLIVPAFRPLLPLIGARLETSNKRAIETLKIDFIDAETALMDAAVVLESRV